MVIFAFVIAEPLPSVTMPEMSALEVWAVAGKHATAMNAANNWTLDMKPPQIACWLETNIREAWSLKTAARTTGNPNRYLRARAGLIIYQSEFPFGPSDLAGK